MNFITQVLSERRSLKKALRDLREKYKMAPSAALAEMIHQLELELSHREAHENKGSGRQKKK